VINAAEVKIRVRSRQISRVVTRVGRSTRANGDEGDCGLEHREDLGDKAAEEVVAEASASEAYE